ncbi:MAG: hypothetical protein ACOYM8_15930 [Caulobacterales bacterium]|jgi:hypothetical protein
MWALIAAALGSKAGIAAGAAGGDFVGLTPPAAWALGAASKSAAAAAAAKRFIFTLQDMVLSSNYW